VPGHGWGPVETLQRLQDGGGRWNLADAAEIDRRLRAAGEDAGALRVGIGVERDGGDVERRGKVDQTRIHAHHGPGTGKQRGELGCQVPDDCVEFL